VNTFQVFLVLLWIAVFLATLVGGWVITQRYAEDADSNDVPLPRALTGTAVRGLGTIVTLSLIVGVPLDLMGF
jgi:hypothetical protein